jgi:hypothetical protein
MAKDLTKGVRRKEEAAAVIKRIRYLSIGNLLHPFIYKNEDY